ncbi:MAG: ABC transporter ATP-binding protein [Desulfobacteraceae bacterium]
MATSNNHDHAVVVRDLVKRFGDFVAVDRVSFELERGEIFGFLGPNGAGKSTTIRMLCGIIAPTSGEGKVAGWDIYREQDSIRHTVGYMSQKFSLYEDLTPLENIRFYLGVYDVPRREWDRRMEWALEMTRLGEAARRLTSELPPGWRQRLALACALLHNPEILFLDEPTSGVDPITRRRFWMFIKGLADGGMTVFVTTHYMDEARNCGRVVMINQGRVVAMGAPPEIAGEVFPDRPEADLDEVFVKLMSRNKET